MKSLTSKAVPPDRGLPNQLHGWLAKSALNPTSPSSHLVLAAPKSSLFFSFKVQVVYFRYFLVSICPPLLLEPGGKADGGKREKSGF